MMKPRMIIRRENGAAAVEFAIILPLLLLLLFGIIEFSLLLYNKAMITNASREGARTGVVFDYDDNDTPDDTSDDTYHPDNAAITGRVDQYLQGRLITFGTPSPTIPIINRTAPDGTVLGDTWPVYSRLSGGSLVVTVTHQYDFLVPFLDVFGPIINQAVTVMRFE